LILWSEGEDTNLPAIGTGVAYPQAANASSLSFGNPEKYGFNISQNNSGTPAYGSGTMQSTINGVAGQLTGTLDDTNNNSILSSPVSLLDSFSLPADNFGRIAGTFTNTGGAGPYFEYYMIDDNQGFLEETDLINSGQVTIGYFAQACDVTSSTSCQTAAGKSFSRRASGWRNARNLSKKK
jgi:hypothetical protein